MQSSFPADNTILIFQTHDSAGRPSPAEFAQLVRHTSLNTLASDAMEFLAPLNPEQTEVPGTFRYRDPMRGSGIVRLEGFGNIEAARIQELVRMEEIARAVGKEPLKNADIAFGNAIALRSNNPWFMVGFGIVAIGFSVWILMRFGFSEPAMAIVAALLLIAGLVLIAIGAIRAPWWLRARRFARSNGETLPSDLKGL